MKRITLLISILLALIVTGTSSVFAHHANTYPGYTESKVTASAKDIGPRGDPLYRFVVNTTLSTTHVQGGLCLPTGTADWLDKVATIVGTGKTLQGSGDCVALPDGKYKVTWPGASARYYTVHSRTFTTANIPTVTVKMHLRITGKGYQKRCFVIPAGDTLKTPWIDLKPNTRYSVVLPGNAGKTIKGRVAPLGWYQAPWRGLQPNAWQYRVPCSAL